MPQKLRVDKPDALEHLGKVLEVALELAQELAGDRLLRRLVTVFRAMPAEDRPPLVDILEREISGRLLSRATEKAVGQETHLNPKARLYVRAHNTELGDRHFDRDEMMIADIRGMRIAGFIRNVPAIYDTWKAAIREAMDHVDEPTRAVAEELLHDVLAAIAEARATDEGATSARGSPDAGERTGKP
jgi:hypothetical protein